MDSYRYAIPCNQNHDSQVPCLDLNCIYRSPVPCGGRHPPLFSCPDQRCIFLRMQPQPQYSPFPNTAPHIPGGVPCNDPNCHPSTMHQPPYPFPFAPQPPFQMMPCPFRPHFSFTRCENPQCSTYFGLPPSGRPPYGSPPFDPSPYGSPPFGPSPFGPPPFDSSPFGPPPFDPPPFGPPSFNPSPFGPFPF